jgi:succinate dehydrogenase / fumarate reductase membrane anchor subunit
MVNKVIASMSLTGNGLKDWLIQRISSLFLGMYVLVLLGFFITHPHLDFLTWRSLFTNVWMQIATLVVLLSLFFHVCVGVWTVITDFINQIAIRLIFQVLIIVALVLYLFWGIKILWHLN